MSPPRYSRSFHGYRCWGEKLFDHCSGEINRLVQSKPEERRVIIEEVAGITKFKLRRRESLKKMEATEQNLLRLNDLKVEIERNLGSLRKQSEKAEKARSLKEN